MKRSTFLDAFYKNAGFVAVFLISTVYIGASFILISKTGKSVYEILATGTLSMMVGLLINGVFRSIGIEKGENDEKTLSTSELYAKTLEGVVPRLDMLDKFCDEENKKALFLLRTRILARAGLKYADCFDEEGAHLKFNPELYTEDEIKCEKFRKRRKMRRQNRKRERAYQNAICVKIKPLTPDSLTSEGSDDSDPFNFGKTKGEYRRSRGVKDAVSRVLMAVIFGYFGVTFVSEVNPATLIWNTLQIIMYVTSGVMQMYSSFSFIVDEHRLSMIKKIDYLEKFNVWAEKKTPREGAL